MGFEGAGGVGGGEAEEVDVFLGKAAGFVERLECADDLAVGAVEGHGEDGLGFVAALGIDFEKAGVLGGVVDDDRFIAGDAGAGETLTEGDTNFGHAVGDFGPQLLVFVVDEPDAAAVGTDQIARHVGIEPEDGVGFACLANSGCVPENNPRNLFVALHCLLILADTLTPLRFSVVTHLCGERSESSKLTQIAFLFESTKQDKGPN